MIPLFGMIVGSAMQAAAIAAKHLHSEVTPPPPPPPTTAIVTLWYRRTFFTPALQLKVETEESLRTRG